MRNRLTLILLFLGIFCCSSFPSAEKVYAEDWGYSEKELKKVRGMSDKELKQKNKEWGKRERETEQEMRDPWQKKLKAEGELNRAKKGEYTAGGMIRDAISNPESLGDNEARVQRAQHNYDSAKKEWEEKRDQHSDALHKESVTDVYLKERQNARKKSR